MKRLLGERWGIGFIAITLAGCGERAEHFAEVEQAIVDGQVVEDNASDSVLVQLVFPSGNKFGSGIIWENEGSVATVLTAAHVLRQENANNSLLKDAPLSATVSRSDEGDIVEEVSAQRFVPHPAAATFFDFRVGDTGRVTDALDLGVVITDAFETARNDVVASETLPNLLVGETLQSQGHGPSFIPAPDQLTDPEELRSLEVSVVAAVPLRPIGKATRAEGFQLVTRATGTGRTVEGDSGGPILEGPGQLVGIHNGFIGAGLMAGLRIADFVPWIEAVRKARGIFVNGRFTSEPRGSQEIDQLIVNTGDLWRVHVEKYNGERIVRDVFRGAGVDVFETVAGLKAGFFDGDRANDAIVQLQVSPSGFRLVQILNPGNVEVLPQPKLLSTTAYSTVQVTRLNGDEVDDLVAQRVSGGEHRFFGTPFGGLEGPFGPGTFASCRNAGPHRATACGSMNADASCDCSATCAQNGGGNCCDDAQDVCTGIVEDEFLASIGALDAVPTIDPDQSATIQPLVRIDGERGQGIGVLLDESWVLMPKSRVAEDMTLVQETVLGDISLNVRQIIGDPESGQALVRVTNAGVLPGHRMRFFGGTPDILEQQTSLLAFGHLGDDPLFSAVEFPQASIYSLHPDAFQLPYSYSLLQTGPLVAAGFQLPPGAPVLSNTGSLVSVTIDTVETEVTRGNQLITAKLHEQQPLLTVNAEPGDDRPSPRYFLNQVRDRDARRNRDRLGEHDLWVFQRPTDEFFPGLLSLPITLPPEPADFVEAGTGVEAGPAIADDGNWTLAGRAKIGSSSVGLVWREIDSGAIQIWQLDDEQQIVRSVDFFVAPPWQISAIEDIDGDGIGDFIWSNRMLNKNFFWLMNDWDSFPDITVVQNDPALLLHYSQWFSGMPLIDEAGDPLYEIMAADHFPTPNAAEIPATGPEQAAADLLWQRVAGSDTHLLSMTLEHRACDELEDALLLAACVDAGGNDILTYEMSRAGADFVKPPEWRLSGTADYNHDAQPDLVWHARELAPTRANEVEIWLSRPSGAFDERKVQRNGQPLVLDIAEGLEVLVR
jgi:hypothetical protein